MKWLQLLFVLSLMFCSSCGLKEREQSIKNKDAELNKRQQALVIWEQELTQKERSLEEREYRLDSTRREIDSVVIHGPSVAGRWQVKMQCVETSCTGSAIGDVKTEQWEFRTSGNEVIVEAYAGKNLIRIYNGKYTRTGMQLTDKSGLSATTMEVTLRMLNEKKMDGIREIDVLYCKTTY